MTESCIKSHSACWVAYFNVLNVLKHSKDLKGATDLNFKLSLGLLIPASLDIILFLANTGYDNPINGYAYFLFMGIIELLTCLWGLFTFSYVHPISTVIWGILIIFREVSYFAFLIICFLVVPYSSSEYLPLIWTIACGFSVIFGFIYFESTFLYFKRYLEEHTQEYSPVATTDNEQELTTITL